jgi:acetyl esterase/lipase
MALLYSQPGRLRPRSRPPLGAFLRLLFLLAVLGVQGSGHAQPAAPAPGASSAGAAMPPSAEVFFRPADIRSAQLSPSGRRLALVAHPGGGHNALLVFDLVAGGPPVQAARFKDLDIDDVHWVNEDRLVFDTVDLERASGDARYAPGLLSVRADGSELRPLVRLRWREQFTEDRIRDRHLLDPNHRLLHVPDGGGDEVIVGEWRWTATGEPDGVIAKRLNVVTGRARSLARDMPEHGYGWLFDAAGEPRVVTTRRAGRVGVHWRGPGDAAWRQIGDMRAYEQAWWPRAVDAAGRLYVTVPDGPAGTSVLKRFDFRTGAPEAEALVSTPGFDFRGQLVSESPGGPTLGVQVVSDAETTVWFDPRLREVQAKIDKELPGRINRLSCRRCGQPDMVVLVTSFADVDPGRLYIWRAGQAQLQPVGRVLRDVEPAQMATLDLHRIRARDGRDLPVWLTQARPQPGTAPAPRPAVVLVHGGPWVRGVTWRWHGMAQFLASRGYLVIEPEFRGSTGYGAEHFRAGLKQWGLTMQDDVADALDWAVAQGLADGRRACIAGASYGGYSTLMGLVRHPERYRCGAAWVAVTDLFLRYQWRTDSDADDETRQHALPELVGDPVADADRLKAASPVQQADRIRAPLFLAFGDRDRRVPLEHGERLRAALIAAGRPPQWQVYAGEGHGGWTLDNQVDFARQLEAFLARHLR